MKKIKAVGICIAVIAGVLLICMVCPLFNIKTVEINGTVNTSASDIKEKLGLNNTVNLLAFNSFAAKDKLLEDPYIEDVSFSRKLPDKLIINIDERAIRGYVPYMGTFLYIDSTGRVLDARSSFTEKHPVVKGLDFDKFTVGHKLETEDDKVFDTVVEISQLMADYDMQEDVLYVDVSDEMHIKIMTENVTINFGDFTDANYKIATLNEILKTMDDDQKGFLDISDPDANPVFKMLT